MLPRQIYKLPCRYISTLQRLEKQIITHKYKFKTPQTLLSTHNTIYKCQYTPYRAREWESFGTNHWRWESARYNANKKDPNAVAREKEERERELRLNPLLKFVPAYENWRANPINLYGEPWVGKLPKLEQWYIDYYCVLKSGRIPVREEMQQTVIDNYYKAFQNLQKQGKVGNHFGDERLLSQSYRNLYEAPKDLTIPKPPLPELLRDHSKLYKLDLQNMSPEQRAEALKQQQKRETEAKKKAKVITVINPKYSRTAMRPKDSTTNNTNNNNNNNSSNHPDNKNNPKNNNFPRAPSRY